MVASRQSEEVSAQKAPEAAQARQSSNMNRRRNRIKAELQSVEELEEKTKTVAGEMV